VIETNSLETLPISLHHGPIHSEAYFCFRNIGMKLPGGPVSEPSLWIVNTIVPAWPLAIQRELIPACAVGAIGNIAHESNVRFPA